MNWEAIIGGLEDLAVERGEFGAADRVPVLIANIKIVTRELLDALESTTWSSGCWCSGKDKRGHSATCAARMAAMASAGRDLVIIPRNKRSLS